MEVIKLEERAYIKDHIYVRLKRIGVQAKELAIEIDKCSPGSSIGNYANSGANTRLRAVIHSIEELAALSDEIRDDARNL